MAPTYQVRLSLPENDLVQQIRKSERDNPSLPDQNIYRFGHTIRFIAHTGDHHIIAHDMDADATLAEFASLRQMVRDNILTGDDVQEAEDQIVEDLELEPPELDSVSENDPLSWVEDVKELLPLYVKISKFQLDYSKWSPDLQKKFSEWFPGAMIEDVGSATGGASQTSERCEEAKPTNEVPECTSIPHPTLEQSRRTLSPNRLPEQPNTFAFPITPQSTASSTELVLRARSRSLALSSEATPAPDAGRRRKDGHIPGHHERVTVSPNTRLKRAPNEIVEEVVNEKQLTIAHLDKICRMYRQWREKNTVDQYGENGKENLDEYYLNLLDMYIIAHHHDTHMLEFKETLFIMFQHAMYGEEDRDLPDMTTAEKAFKFLPEDAPLCEWINLVYSHLWSTEKAGNPRTFWKNNPNFERNSLASLFYGITHTRCKYTTGHDAAVLKKWCKWHSHKPGSREEKLCKDMKAANKLSFEQAEKEERRLAWRKAKELLEELGSEFENEVESESECDSESKYDAKGSRISQKRKAKALKSPGSAKRGPGRPRKEIKSKVVKSEVPRRRGRPPGSSQKHTY